MEIAKTEAERDTPKEIKPTENEIKARGIMQEFGKLCAMYGDAHFKELLAMKAKGELEIKMTNLQVDYEKIQAKIQKEKQELEKPEVTQ